MGTLQAISWEMMALIVTVIAGFARMNYLIGRRTGDIDTLKNDVKKVSEGLHDHEDDCKNREALRLAEEKERNGIVDGRFAEGSKQLALLKMGQENMAEDIREIKDLVKQRG